jgi:hypothetical protein
VSWAIDRRFIPTTAGNDTADEGEQIVIWYKPFAVGAREQFVRDCADVAARMVDEAKPTQDAMNALRAKIDAGEAVDDAEVSDLVRRASEIQSSQQEALHKLAFERVTKASRGDDVVTDWHTVWERVADDAPLTQEIAEHIIESAAVRAKEVPTSASPSTGPQGG